MTSSNDGGSNPEQYGLPAGATELQDLIEHREMNFSVGNIFKACYRMGNCSHSDKRRDLKKIIWFAERELARTLPEKQTPASLDMTMRPVKLDIEKLKRDLQQTMYPPNRYGGY